MSEPFPAHFHTPSPPASGTSKTLSSKTPPTSRESSVYSNRSANMERNRSIDRRHRSAGAGGFSSDDDNGGNASGDNTLDNFFRMERSTEMKKSRTRSIREDVQSTGDLEAASRRRARENMYARGARLSRRDDSMSMGDFDAGRRRPTRDKPRVSRSARTDFDDVKSLGDMSKISLSTQQLEELTPQELARRRLKKQQKMAIRRQAEKIEGENFDEPRRSLGDFLNKNRGDDSDEAQDEEDASDDNSSDNDTFHDMFHWSTTAEDPKVSASKSVGGRPSLSRSSGSVAGSRSVGMSAGRSVSSLSRASGSLSSSRGVGSLKGVPARTKSSLGSYADSLSLRQESVRAEQKGDVDGLNEAEWDLINSASDALGTTSQPEDEGSRRRRSTQRSRSSRSRHTKSVDDMMSLDSRHKSRKSHKSSSRGSSDRRKNRRDDDSGKRSTSRPRASSDKERKSKRSTSKSRKSSRDASLSPRDEEDRSKTGRKERKKSSKKSSKSQDGTRRSKSKKRESSKRSKSTSRPSSRAESQDGAMSPMSFDRREYDSAYDSQYETNNEGGFTTDANFSDADNSEFSDRNASSRHQTPPPPSNNDKGVDSDGTPDIDQDVLLQFDPSTPGHTEKTKLGDLTSSFVRISNADGSYSEGLIMEMPETTEPETDLHASTVSALTLETAIDSNRGRGRGRKKVMEVVQGAKDLMERARSRSRGRNRSKSRPRQMQQSTTGSTKSSSGELYDSDNDEMQLLKRSSSHEYGGGGGGGGDLYGMETPRRRKMGLLLRKKLKEPTSPAIAAASILPSSLRSASKYSK